MGIAVAQHPDIETTVPVRGPLEERLETGDVLTFEPCPFPLPSEAAREFLFQQQLELAKEIVFDPQTGDLFGQRRQSPQHDQRLKHILGDLHRQATAWLAKLLPDYARGWKHQPVRFHPEEEATRKLRPQARNDLLHIDALFARSTEHHRILRLFVNLNPVDPRIWMTSATFRPLLEQFGRQVGLPAREEARWTDRLSQHLVRLFKPHRTYRTEYDWFLMRFADFLKTCDEFQERAPKKLWRFPPGSAWLVFTDGLAHAELRGRYTLDFCYLVPPEALQVLSAWPVQILQEQVGHPLLPQVA